MSHSGTLKKYLLTVKLLENSLQQYLPLRTIQKHLEAHGFSAIAYRTMLRDFETLRAEFGISIEYNRKERGWYINTNKDEDLSDYKQFIKLLELAERVETLTRTLKATSDASRYVVFEQNEFFKGSDHISCLLDAIQRKLMIRFDYQSFDKDSPSPYAAEPYLIVEYRNRWYLLAWDRKTDRLKTFGLDRIINIMLTNELISGDRGLSYKTLFKHTYGITCLPEEPQRIVLSFK